MGVIRVTPKQGPNRVKIGTPVPQVFADQFSTMDGIRDDAAASASAAEAAQHAAEVAEGAAFATVDSGTATLISDPVAGPSTQAALRATFTDRPKQPINVANYGFSRSSVIAALDEADARGRGAVAYFPAGVYDVGAGLPMATRSAQIRGDGAYTADGGATPHKGTIFHATTQNGPVLDFTDYRPPWNFQGKVTIEGFLVRGSGVADPTKNNSGIRFKVLGSATVRDIAIMDTGGPCLEGVSSPGNAVYLSDFERIILNAPISAAANDVPWMQFNEANCCNFTRIGLRALGSGANVGPSGAVRIDSPPAFSSASSRFDAFWFENLILSNGAAIVAVSGRKHQITDSQFIDCFKVAGASNTAHIRFLVCPGGSQGGNEVRGVIPGRDPDFPTTAIDYGVDLVQGYNRVTGVKGRNGYNVRTGASTSGSYIHLGGSAGSSLTPAVVDQNTGVGNYQTTIIDAATQSMTGWQSITATAFIEPYTSTAGSITLSAAQHTIETIGGTQTITLPDPTTVTRGRGYTIKHTSGGTLTVVSAGTSKTIDGASSDSLTQWQCGRYVSNGTQWVKL